MRSSSGREMMVQLLFRCSRSCQRGAPRSRASPKTLSRVRRWYLPETAFVIAFELGVAAPEQHGRPLETAAHDRHSRALYRVRCRSACSSRRVFVNDDESHIVHGRQHRAAHTDDKPL